MAETRKRKVKEPTADEKDKLRAIFQDTCLYGAHGIIVSNVREAVRALLTSMNREDLLPMLDTL